MKQSVIRVASSHILKALLTSLNRGEQKANSMMFGDSLDRLTDEANADLVEASRYLDVLMDILILDPQNGSHIARALQGLSRHMDSSLESLGKFRGNPMSRMAVRAEILSRVASQRNNEEDDWARSLNGLIRSTQGLWKSDRQAKFLLKQLKSHHRRLVRDRSPAITWAKRYKWFDLDTMIVFSHVEMLPFGRRDKSKIRYGAWFYVLDEYGVRAKARAEYIHAKGGDDFKGISGKAKLEFKRPDRLIGDVVVPVSGVESAEEAWDRRQKERAENVAKNKTLIDGLKSHPDYHDRDILQSFVEQLEEGHTLSPKQMYIVNKFLGTDQDLGVGDKSEWSSLWEEFLQLYVSKLVPNMLKSPIFDEVQDEDYRAELHEGAIQYLEQGVKPGSFGGYPGWVTTEVEAVLQNLAPRLKSIRQQESLVEMSQQIQRSLKRKKPTKKALGYLLDLKKLVETLRGASPQAIAKALR